MSKRTCKIIPFDYKTAIEMADRGEDFVEYVNKQNDVLANIQNRNPKITHKQLASQNLKQIEKCRSKVGSTGTLVEKMDGVGTHTAAIFNDNNKITLFDPNDDHINQPFTWDGRAFFSDYNLHRIKRTATTGIQDDFVEVQGVCNVIQQAVKDVKDIKKLKIIAKSGDWKDLFKLADNDKFK